MPPKGQCRLEVWWRNVGRLSRRAHGSLPTSQAEHVEVVNLKIAAVHANKRQGRNVAGRTANTKLSYSRSASCRRVASRSIFVDPTALSSSQFRVPEPIVWRRCLDPFFLRRNFRKKPMDHPTCPKSSVCGQAYAQVVGNRKSWVANLNFDGVCGQVLHRGILGKFFPVSG